jgi:hypothetical protein
VGVAIVEDLKIVMLEHIDLGKHKTMFDKADHVADFIFRLRDDRIDQTFIEDAMMKFTPGMSSAQTIATLLRFNGIVSYIVWRELHIHPQYIAPNAARKLCGVKTEQVKKCGKSHKQQVFEYMAANDLKDVEWPKKQRSENIVDWAKDTTDAYVIAKAGNLLNIHGTP